jgi:class 3 adenylate cyclase
MSRLTRFLSPKVSDLIMSTATEDSLKARRDEITVAYVDLRGFTSFTETAEPEEVMSVLRQYHAELGRLIMLCDGTIEHFAGDGMMSMFNAPLPDAPPSLPPISSFACGTGSARGCDVRPAREPHLARATANTYAPSQLAK